jgi:hypothetical protein
MDSKSGQWHSLKVKMEATGFSETTATAPDATGLWNLPRFVNSWYKDFTILRAVCSDITRFLGGSVKNEIKQNFDYLSPDYPSFSINRHCGQPLCVRARACGRLSRKRACVRYHIVRSVQLRYNFFFESWPILYSSYVTTYIRSIL